mgnify:CR=1 FL=1
MMLHMKHISQRKMYHTVFLNVKEQEPVQSNLEVFLRMPDLQEYVLAQQSFRKCGDVMLHSLWARRHGTKYNGAPYIVQKAGAAVYTEAGKAQIKEQIAYYQKNARTIYEGLKNAGYTVSGAVNSPYVWLKTPDNMTSWEFFDFLLEKANVVGTPGSGTDFLPENTPGNRTYLRRNQNHDRRNEGQARKALLQPQKRL